MDIQAYLRMRLGELGLGALFVGLFAMVRGGEFNDKYGNRMMRLRVILQGVALVLFVLAVIASSA